MPLVEAYGKTLEFPEDMSHEDMANVIRKNEHLLNPDYKQPAPEAMDYAKGFAAGANKLVSGLGYLAEVAGAEETGKSIREFGDRGAAFWNQKMSPGGKAAAESQVFVDDPESITGLRLGDNAGRALLMGASQSLPSMFAAALPGAAITKGIQALASLGLAGGAGATIPLLAGTAAPVGTAANVVSRIPSAIGFGAAEGITAGAMNAAEFKSSIENMPEDELSKSPVYIALKATHGSDKARELIANQAASDIFGRTALSTGAIGAVTGGGALGQAYQKATIGAGDGILKSIAKGAGQEALQETPQSGGEKYIENLATRDYLNPDVDVSSEVLSSAASGGAIGAFTGGIFGGGSAINITSDAQSKADRINAERAKLGLDKIVKSETVDQAINAANESVSQKPVDKDDVLRVADPTLADIERLTGLKPSESLQTAQDELQRQSQAVQQNIATGSDTEIVLPDNKTLKARWDVVDADNVKASLKNGVSQPRDRTRAASDVQIQEIANQPDYRRLADSPVMDIGAPVISVDGQIVGGNGRFEALSRAYDQGTHKDYLERLKQDAINKGIDPTILDTMKKPVLVRRISEPFDTRQLAIKSNSGFGLPYSDLELSMLDAERMKGIENLDVLNDGNIALTSKNFLQLKDSLGDYQQEELADIQQSDGTLSQQGVKRIRNAMLAKAYGDNPVLGKIIESTDSDIKTILGSLTRVAGDVVRARSTAPKESDITPNLLDAINIFSQLKQKGQSVTNYLSQQDAFTEQLDPVTENVLLFLDKNSRSQPKVTQYIRDAYTKQGAIDATSPDIFGQEPPEVKDIFAKPTIEEELEKHLKKNGYDFDVRPIDQRDINALDDTKKAQKDIAEKQAKIFNKKIVFVKAKGEFGINGVMVPAIKDTIFINIETPKPFHAVMAHELSHWMEQEHPSVYKDMLGSLKDVIVNEEGYRKKYGITEQDEGLIQKEIAADLMGDNFTDETFWNKVAAANPDKWKEIAKRIIQWLKNTILKAKSRGMGSEEWVNDAKKAQDIIANAVAQYTKQQDAVGKDIKFHKAFHGSPHDHNKFDKSKIGTGEGAQAYGYGHYFTDTKEVAEYYKNALANENSLVYPDGRFVNVRAGATPEGFAQVILSSNKGDYQKTRIEISGYKSGNSDTDMFYDEAINKLQGYQDQGVTVSGRKGKLYEVELAPEQDEYLLWDKPLSEQSEKVKAALKGKIIANGVDILSGEKQQGRDIYKLVARTLDGDKNASEFLHKHGIRGIKYLDGSSRAKGEGAYNYVIFDDNDISITAKFSRQPDTINIDGTERPTTNSEGKRIHPTEEGIRNFWKWFGDSKVVDDQGRPLVVYHGTDDQFNEVDMYKGAQGVFWFTSDKQKIINGESGAQGTGKIMELYVKIDNPADYEKYDNLLIDQYESENLDGAILKDPDGSFDGFVIKENQIKSAIGNTGAFSEDNNDIRFSFAGELAETANKHQLSAAQQRLDAGEDADIVRQETGWFKGADGKWRYEIDDSEAFLKTNNDGSYVIDDIRKNGVRAHDKIPLFRVLGHDKLFAAYPDLADISVKFNYDMKGSRARFERISRSIELSPELNNYSEINNLKSVLLHEIQHGIQAIEGFATGMPTNRAEDIVAESKLKEQQIKSKIDLLYTKNRDKAISMIKNGDNTDFIDIAYKKWSDRLGVKSESNPFGVTKEDAVFYELSENDPVLSINIENYNKHYRIKSLDGYEFYRRLYGEAEARNVQTRMKMSEQERKLLSPESTQDVSNRDVIITYNSMDMENAPPPKNAKPFNPNEDIPETFARKIQRKFQDKFNRFNVVKEYLEREEGIKISENADVYGAEERYHAKVANQHEDFRSKVRNPLVEKIAKAGFKLDDVEQYLLNRHAQEANVQNRKLTGKSDSTAYGITDEDAEAYLAKAPKELAELADEVQALTNKAQQLRLDNGIETQERIDAMNAAYQYYVPVRGGAEEQAKQQGSGKGLSVKYKPKRRLGHELRNESVIENIFQDYERAVVEVEKNRVGKSLALMAAEIQMPELISINKPEKRKVLRNEKAYGVLVKGELQDVFQTEEAAKQNRQLLVATDKKLTLSDVTIAPITDQRLIYSASPMLADNEVLVYMDGHEVRLQINDELLAQAYKNMGMEPLGSILSVGRAINGWMSKVYTAYNPEFFIINVLRDFTSGMINLTGEQGIGISAKAIANYPKAFSSLLKYATTGQSDRWIDAYRDNGGNTGAAYLSDLERLGEEVRKEYASYQGVIANLKEKDVANALRAAGRKVFNATIRYMENLNQAGENAFRLATFKAMVESGKSAKESGSMAKNVTVNFNRKGEVGAQMNALYLFFNASIQGTAAVSHALFKGKNKYQAWGLAGSMMTFGYIAASMLGGFDDEDEYDSISDFVKSRNLIISYGDGYVKIPVPYGHGFFYNAGRMYAEAQRKDEIGKLPYQLAALATEEFSPFNIAQSEDSSFDSRKVTYGLIPTAIRIPVEITNNYSTFTGRELYPEKAWYKSEPDNEKMFRGTKGTVYDVSAQYLASIGVEISPETLKYLSRTATGGAGAFVDSTVSAAMLKSQGAELDTREIPFVRKFYGEATIQDVRARYNKAREEAREAYEKFNALRKKNDLVSVRNYFKDNKELLALNNYANKLSEVIKHSRDQQDLIKLSDDLTIPEKRLKIKELEKQEKYYYDLFLNRHKKVKGRQRQQH